MKPLRLKMYGVGPYAEEVDIDFARLNEEGLFLITGATGAGKTSIFDGITYALYGETNYGDAEKKNGIICDFLNEEDHGDAYVEFTFEVDGVEYTVKRVPAYYKLRRGVRNKTKTGETVEIESSPSRSIPGKKEDRDRFIREEVLGVDAAQFKKLIMLPQGAFSEFIRSSSRTKKETLEKIFDTGIYEEISQQLRNKVKELGTGISKERERIFAKLETLSLEDERWKELMEERLLSFEELQEIIGVNKRSLQETSERLDKEIEGIDIGAVVEEIARGEAHNKGVRDLRVAKEGLEIHEKRTGEIESRTEELSRYKRAQGLKVEYAAKERAAKEYERGLESYKRDRDQLETFRSLNDERIEALEKKKESLKEASQRVNTLEVLKKDVERYLELLKEMESDKERLGEMEKTKLEGLRVREEELVSQGQKLEEGLRMISIGLERGGELRIELERVQVRKAKLEELVLEHERNQRGRMRMSQMEGELELLKKTQMSTWEEYSRTNTLLLQAEAYKIAGGLQEGEACPVCGSLEHPKPAEKPEGTPSVSEVERYKAAYDEAGSSKDRYAGEVESYRGSLREKEEELTQKLEEAGIESYEGLLRGRDEAEDSLRVISKEVSELPGKMELQEVEEGLQKNRKDLEAVKEEIQRSQREAESLRTKIHMEEAETEKLRSALEDRGIDTETFEGTLREALAGKSRIEKEVGETEGLREERDRRESHLARDEKHLKESLSAMEELRKVFEEKLTEQGFLNEGEYLSGSAIAGEVLEREISEYRNEGIRLTAIIEERKVYDGMDEVSLEELQRKKDEMTERVDNLRREMAGNISRIEVLEDRAKDLKVTEERIGKEERILSVYKKLSDISEGKYGDKKNNIGFQNYVLGVYFEEVLDRANERLAVMTSNQYEMVLHRRDKSSKGEAGLDINVFDSHTGRERSIKTLSGGETFKASMALALGLSDVVQGQNGGIQLDSVFIDEGFGTLDEESLSAAMDILMELKSSGRTVGIISHVNELKQTINCQIRVEKSTRGSSLEVVY